MCEGIVVGLMVFHFCCGMKLHENLEVKQLAVGSRFLVCSTSGIWIHGLFLSPPGRKMMKQWHLHCNMICRNSPTQNALGASVNLTLTGAKTLKTRRKPGCWAMCNTISRSAGVNVLQIAG
jgi:hypothetical protein